MHKNYQARLTPDVEKRLKRGGGEQPRRGQCIICGGDWAECPHNRAQTDLLEQAYRLKQVLR